MHIGEVLKQIRNKHGLTQKQVSDKVKITQAYLSHIESGNYNPSEECLKKLAKLYGIPSEIIHLATLDKNRVPKNKRKFFSDLKDPLLKLFIELS